MRFIWNNRHCLFRKRRGERLGRVSRHLRRLATGWAADKPACFRHIHDNMLSAVRRRTTKLDVGGTGDVQKGPAGGTIHRFPRHGFVHRNALLTGSIRAIEFDLHTLTSPVARQAGPPASWRIFPPALTFGHAASSRPERHNCRRASNRLTLWRPCPWFAVK